ncbi:MAG: ATP-binding protein [Limnohabitans sp.]|nr:ATP-binding protein [Limnohabitans sp.]
MISANEFSELEQRRIEVAHARREFELVDHDGQDGCGSKARARICVADNGCGMSDVPLARAREPFYTTKPAGRGTGLGLAMVSSSVSAAAGLMSIESTMGVGTEVSMLLPLVAL